MSRITNFASLFQISTKPQLHKKFLIFVNRILLNQFHSKSKKIYDLNYWEGKKTLSTNHLSVLDRVYSVILLGGGEKYTFLNPLLVLVRLLYLHTTYVDITFLLDHTKRSIHSLII